MPDRAASTPATAEEVLRQYIGSGSMHLQEPANGKRVVTAREALRALDEIIKRKEQADLYARNCERSMDAAEEHEQRMRDALERALDFAEEGWGYASDYFRKKWNYDGEIAALRGVLELRAEIGAQDA